MFAFVTEWLRKQFRESCIQGVRDAIDILQGRNVPDDSPAALALRADLDPSFRATPAALPTTPSVAPSDETEAPKRGRKSVTA